MNRSPSKMVPVPISLSRTFLPILQIVSDLTDKCARAKKQVTEQGGSIVNEFKLIKGFTYVPCLNITSAYG